MNAKVQRVLCCLLALVLTVSLFSAIPAAAAEPATIASESRSGAVQVQQPANAQLIAATSYQLVPGVTETQVILNQKEKEAQVAGFLATIAPDADVAFRASYAGYYTEGSTAASRKEAAKDLKWNLQTTTKQAAAYEAATGENVILATNGDYYNMQTAQPLGYLIMEGNVIQGRGEPYFAVLKDGSYALRDAGADCSDVQEAISGPFFLVRGGQIVVSAEDTALMPRNSIGLKADGTVVTFVADGRQDPYSVGQTLYELAEFLLAQGVTDALYLDGGGSATYATQREGEDALVIRNSPSDGTERAVSSALMLVSRAQPTGEFDHAVLSPNNEQYTPGSSVQFSAVGVDAAGGQAELPEGLQWSVTDAAAGSVDANGLFTAAAGYTGTVTVQLCSGETVVGSTSIVIAEIDALYFTGESISLDFGASSDLGLNIKANRRSIVAHAGDFGWSMDNDALGSFSGNLFTAAKADSTLTGKVTVTHTTLSGKELRADIQVEVGKMPVVLFDFEPDENGEVAKCAHYHWGSSYFVDNGTTEGYRGAVDTVEVITGGKYSGSPTRATVSAPFRFTGNFDTAVPAADIFRANGYDFYLWPGTPPLTEYNCGELKITRSDAGEVRFGEAAMELDYDYASYDGSRNANYYIRYCGEDIDIEGYPSEIGVWVYAPEGTAKYTPYIQVAAWNGSDYTAKYFPLKRVDTGETGITWSGWMYCYADLTGIWSMISTEHPLKIEPGQGLIWLSYQPKNGGGRYNGSLYFDNVRVVYGTNMDDLVNPVIGTTTVNGAELAEDGSTVLNSNYVELITNYDDPESENRSGIHAEATIITIDGERKNADKSTTQTRSNASLNNGVHTIGITVFDTFGNSATKNYSFTIRSDAQTPEIRLAGSDTVTMGGTYTLTLTATDALKNATVELAQLNTQFGEPTVAFAAGYTGSYTYEETGFRKAALHLEAERREETAGTELCTITFRVPSDLDPEIDFFTYQPVTIRYTAVDGASYSAAQPYRKLALSAYYTIVPGMQTEGDSSTVTVLDSDGKPAADVSIFLNGTEIGKTDAAGKLVTDAMAALPAGTTYTLTASSTLGVSFATKGTVLAHAGGSGKPIDIHQNAVQDGSTQASIGWFANAAAAQQKAVIRYMTAASYENALRAGCTADSFDFSKAVYVQLSGSSEKTAFPISKDAALVNQVRLTDLKPGTTYYYFVGDGTDGAWSDPMSFTTTAKSSEVSFLVIGDTQMSGSPAADTDAISILQQIGSQVKGRQFNFALQTGDFVDNGGSYDHWNELLELFQQNFRGLTFAHTLGNHEYYGDASGDLANAILDQPARDYYSVEYGNVYLAVINNGAKLSEAAQWLIRDAQASDCTWKILSVHQPAYYTNPNGGSDAYHNILPAAVDAAGIDAVFSGHDHSYARTQPMTGGEVDEKNGAVYFICGDLGEKSRQSDYAIVDDPAFHFARTSQDYSGLYLTVHATEDTMEITAHDCDGTVIDSTTLANGVTVKQVEDLIDAIGTVDENSKDAIDAARAAYDALPTRLQPEVSNYDKLVKAEKDYTDLLTAVEAAQKAAEDARKAFENAKAAQEKAEAAKAAAEAAQKAAEEAAQASGENSEAAKKAQAAAEEAQAKAEAAQAAAEEAQAGAEAAQKAAEDAAAAAAANNALAAEAAAKAAEEAAKSAEEAAKSAASAEEAAKSAADAAEAMLKAQKAQKAAEDAEKAAEEAEKKAEEAQKKAEEAAASAAEDREAAEKAAEKAAEEAKAAQKAAEDARKSAEDAKSAAELAAEAAEQSNKEAAASAAQAAEYAKKMAEAYEEIVRIKAELVEYLAKAQAEAERAEAERKAAEEAQRKAEEAALAAAKYAAAYELAQLQQNGEGLTGHAKEAYDKALADAAAAIEAAKTPAEVDAALAAAREALNNALCPSAAFTDVEENVWYHDGIDFMVRNGYMNGVAADTFDVEGSLTRAQLVTVLYRLAGEPETSAAIPFADVADGQWYTKAIVWAAENGIVKGVNETTFAPNDPITREQIAVILYRYAHEENTEDGKLTSFPDAKDISGYALEAMNWAVARGLINGSDGKLLPQDTATRAQIAVILARYLNA